MKKIFSFKINNSREYQHFTDRDENTTIYFDKITLINKSNNNYNVKVHVAIKNLRKNNYHFYETTIKTKDGNNDYLYSNDKLDNDNLEKGNENNIVLDNNTNNDKFKEIFEDISKEITII